MRRATVGRITAAVGVLTMYLAIWLAAIGAGEFSTSYWNIDGTLGGVLLALACVAALAAAGAFITRRPALDLMLGGAGAVLFGVYLFFPAALAFANWDALRSGAWLGVCGGLVLIGAAGALWDWVQARSAIEWTGVVVAAVGGVLVLLGIWFDVDVEGGSYWNSRDSGHGIGVLFLILLGLWVIAALAGVRARKAAPLALAAGIALVTLGLALFGPAAAAFNNLGDLRIGAWLPFAGGILLALGSILTPRVDPASAAGTSSTASAETASQPVR